MAIVMDGDDVLLSGPELMAVVKHWEEGNFKTLNEAFADMIEKGFEKDLKGKKRAKKTKSFTALGGKKKKKKANANNKQKV